MIQIEFFRFDSTQPIVRTSHASFISSELTIEKKKKKKKVGPWYLFMLSIYASNNEFSKGAFINLSFISVTVILSNPLKLCLLPSYFVAEDFLIPGRTKQPKCQKSF